MCNLGNILRITSALGESKLGTKAVLSRCIVHMAVLGVTVQHMTSPAYTAYKSNHTHIDCFSWPVIQDTSSLNSERGRKPSGRQMGKCTTHLKNLQLQLNNFFSNLKLLCRCLFTTFVTPGWSPQCERHWRMMGLEVPPHKQQPPGSILSRWNAAMK